LNYPNARDCEHGYPRRKCPHCEINKQDEEIELLRNENRRLKRALAFWIPHVPDEGTARGDRIAADAYLLWCYEGPDEVDAETLGWIALTPNVK